MWTSTVAADGHFAIGMRARQLAGMAMALSNVFVLQTTASHLFQLRNRVLRGMAFDGPALFSVYSGGDRTAAAVPPYLVAAAAMESRAFPAYTYDPSAGPNWAARFDLGENSQADRDWPVQEFTYEDEGHQAVRTSAAGEWIAAPSVVMGPSFSTFRFARIGAATMDLQ